MPPVVAFPSLALGSAGGGDSTERETMWAPRTMVRPRVRFASVSTVWLAPEPGAPPAFACFDLIFRNSSVSARTTFICWDRDVSMGALFQISDGVAVPCRRRASGPSSASRR